jgi:hypothetical protein
VSFILNILFERPLVGGRGLEAFRKLTGHGAVAQSMPKKSPDASNNFFKIVLPKITGERNG